MSIRIGINGFGRIGKIAARIISANQEKYKLEKTKAWNDLEFESKKTKHLNQVANICDEDEESDSEKRKSIKKYERKL